MAHRFNRTKVWLLCVMLALLATSFYLAHLSGRAMNNAVGDTFESLNLSALSALAGMPAMILGISLLVAEQTGGIFVRSIKLVATTSGWLFMQTFVCFLIQLLSAP